MDEIKGGGQATLCDLEQRSNHSSQQKLNGAFFKEVNSERVPGHDEGDGWKNSSDGEGLT